MEPLKLEPESEYKFEKLFDCFKNLKREIPYKFKIINTIGGLDFFCHYINGASVGEGVNLIDNPFDKELINDPYSFKTIEGCTIDFEIWQLGSKITS